MKKLSYLIGLLSITIVMASCVRERVPEPYYPQQYTFVDEFTDNRNGWQFDDPANYAYGDIYGGTFKFVYNDDLTEAYYISKNIGFNRNNDFTIQTRIGSNNNMGLLFGYNSQVNSYGYSFMIDYDGYYALYDEGGNGYGSDIEALTPLVTGNFVNYNGDWNEIKFEQVGNRWIGSINGYQVFNIEAQRLKGSSVGFVNTAFTEGEADYLQVDWIE